MVDGSESLETRIEVRDDPDNRQYTAYVDGHYAGRTEYRVRRNTYLFLHTEVDPEYQRSGVARRLARAALDDVRKRGGTVVPICPLIAAFIKRNPEYEEIVDHEMTDRLRRGMGES